MAIATDILDMLQGYATARLPWEKHWRDIAVYSLPGVDRFDTMFQSGRQGTLAAIDAVVSEPVAARDAKSIYDQTSLWAVERGTAGFMSLVTPSSEKWHGVKLADPFADDPTDEERRWLEKYRDYLHAMRANPATGFWLAHKMAMRGIWSLGTSVIFVNSIDGGGASSPISYRYVPLSECYMATNFEGVVDTLFRSFVRSARNCVEKWGEACSAEVKAAAADPKKKDTPIELVHAVFPRKEMTDMARPGVLGGDYASFYVEAKTKHLIGESGYFSFPFVVHHWNRSGQGPYAEGPMAIALADVKSLNMLAKNALMASQQAVNPPMGMANDGLTRLNLNPGAPNIGAVSEEGRLLVQPIVTAPRPDFAQVVIEAKQNQIRESLYVNLWQNILDPKMTATEALIRNQEKGEMLGPAGNSVMAGLNVQFDRETDILFRKNAFRPGEALAPPRSLAGRPIGVRSSSPLDRLQRTSELVGMQRLVEFAGMLAQVGKTEVLDRFDADEMIDIAQEILNAPRRALRPSADVAEGRQQRAQMEQLIASLQAAKAGGEAAKAGGDGMAAMAGAMQAGNRAPAAA